MSEAGAWVLARESGPTFSLVPTGTAVGPEPVTPGRAATVPLGVHLVDEGISRTAVTLTAGRSGWLIEIGNRNGAVLRPWGLAPQRALATQTVRWPLVAIRISGTQRDQQHWLLLENDAYAEDGLSEDGRTIITRLGNPPPPLAPAELQALQLAMEKALRLGLPSPTTLTNPDYLHVLGAAGYLRPGSGRPFRRRERVGPVRHG